MLRFAKLENTQGTLVMLSDNLSKTCRTYRKGNLSIPKALLRSYLFVKRTLHKYLNCQVI